MADTARKPAVPLNKYIGVGCLRFDFTCEAQSASPALLSGVAEWRTAELRQRWLFAVHPDDDPTSVAGLANDAPTSYLLASIQNAVLERLGSPLKRLFQARWVQFSCHLDDSTEDGDDKQVRGICRVYVLPDDKERRTIMKGDGHYHRERQQLLELLDYSPRAWRLEYDKDCSHSRVSRQEAVISDFADDDNDDDDEADNGNGIDNNSNYHNGRGPAFGDLTLLQMFNRIPSPKPLPDLAQNEMYQEVLDAIASTRIRGLKTKLYSYQSRSASVMLQRELFPGRIRDPRFATMINQETGLPWYYDDYRGYVLSEPQMYDGPSGGILAEEMGTGKTLICLALILATKAFPAVAPDMHLNPGAGSQIIRPRVGSLADMVAAVITRNAVPWKLYFEGADADEAVDAAADSGGAGGKAEYKRCIEAIKRNPASYTERPFHLGPWSTRVRTQTETADEPQTIMLSSCSLVIAPNNLIRHWQQEIAKHTTGLKFIVVKDTAKTPLVEEILETDILLFSMTAFQGLAKARESVRWGYRLDLPMASVHFKRVIVDEGHRLGNSSLGNKSNLLLVLDCLRSSARWVVTGTPSTGLYGFDEEQRQLQVLQVLQEPSGEQRKEARTRPFGAGGADVPRTTINGAPSNEDAAPHTPITALGKQERRDLERIGAIAMLYLKMKPWANRDVETSAPTNDWSVYILQPQHSHRSCGRIDCLRTTLNTLVIRHRKSDVKELLPPVVERLVRVDGSYQDKLCLNLFSMMIIFNAVQSQRKDQDYFFHPRQRGALQQLLSNMRQSTFFGGFFYSAEEITKAIDTAEHFLQERKVAISDVDERLLREAISFGYVARNNKLKQLANQYHEIPVFVKDFPGGSHLAEAWSLDGEEEGGEEKNGEEGGAGVVEQASGASWPDDDKDEKGKKRENGENGEKSEQRALLTCTAAPLIHILQRFVRPCMDAPHSLKLLFDDGRFAEKGRKARNKARHEIRAKFSSTSPKKRGSPHSKAALVLAGNTGLGDGDGGNTKLTRRGDGYAPAQRLLVGRNKVSEKPVFSDENAMMVASVIAAEAATAAAKSEAKARPAEALAGARLMSTASAKLSYLLDEIVRHEAEEQMIVFYDNDNVAFYLAEHLEILQVEHLIYARSISTARREQYVELFNQEQTPFRVLLMDIAQAAFGLDMWAASRVYFVSPVLNPQVEAQAIGRVRRISQRKQVTVETLVLRDSVEELILERRQSMTPVEHRKLKSMLDDQPIYEWVLNAKILPLLVVPGQPEESQYATASERAAAAQMAPLQTPQPLFGREAGGTADAAIAGQGAEEKQAALANGDGSGRNEMQTRPPTTQNGSCNGVDVRSNGRGKRQAEQEDEEGKGQDAGGSKKRKVTFGGVRFADEPRSAAS